MAKQKHNDILLGLSRIPYAEYKRRLRNAKRRGACWICGKKLKKNEECVHIFH